jgi:hypothetical protein
MSIKRDLTDALLGLVRRLCGGYVHVLDARRIYDGHIRYMKGISERIGCC